MEYVLLDQNQALLMVVGLMVFGSFMVGFLIGYLTKNYQMDSALRRLEEHVEEVTGRDWEIFDDYK